jgi:hypothetical protein
MLIVTRDGKRTNEADRGLDPAARPGGPTWRGWQSQASFHSRGSCGLQESCRRIREHASRQQAVRREIAHRLRGW